MSNKTFKVVGVSTCDNGKTKVRFANDLASRCKILNRSNHTNIELIELDTEMSKADAVAYLKTTEFASDPTFAEAIQLADEKYNGDSRVRLAGKVSDEVSLDSIKAKVTAGSKVADTEADTAEA
jgi:hypothetical protein